MYALVLDLLNQFQVFRREYVATDDVLEIELDDIGDSRPLWGDHSRPIVCEVLERSGRTESMEPRQTVQVVYVIPQVKGLVSVGASGVRCHMGKLFKWSNKINAILVEEVLIEPQHHNSLRILYG